MTPPDDAADPLVEIRSILIGASLDEQREHLESLRQRVEDEVRTGRRSASELRAEITSLSRTFERLETAQHAILERLERLEQSALSRGAARALLEETARKLEDGR